VLYRPGALTEIHVPTEAEEAVQDLFRRFRSIFANCRDLNLLQGARCRFAIRLADRAANAFVTERALNVDRAAAPTVRVRRGWAGCAMPAVEPKHGSTINPETRELAPGETRSIRKFRWFCTL
jgi:hypothetical protein